MMKEIRTQSERKLKSYHSREALLLFTDASETHWALIILQTPYEEVNLQDIKAMKPEPMMFLSGKFAKTEMNWHISQKEMYPPSIRFQKGTNLQWLLYGHPGPIFFLYRP